jgi:hypothetical protein
VKIYKKLCTGELNFYPSSELMLICREENGKGAHAGNNKHIKFKLENLLEKIQLGDQSVKVTTVNIRHPV